MLLLSNWYFEEQMARPELTAVAASQGPNKQEIGGQDAGLWQLEAL